MAKWPEHPFRLFFLLVCLAAPLALLPWLSLIFWPPGFFPLHWHAFAFINLLGGAAFVGFLFTAWPSWTGPRPLKRHSYSLLTLWLALAFSLPWPALAQPITLIFWVYLLLFISGWTLKNKRPKLLSFSAVLLAIFILNLSYYRKNSAVYLHLLVDVMLIAVAQVNFRVGMVLGNEALKLDTDNELRFVANGHFKNIAVLSLWAYGLAVFFGASREMCGYLAAAVACACGARLQDWHSTKLLRAPYVRANYLIHWVLTLGYGALALAYLFRPAWFSPARHFLALGAFLGAILLIMSVAGLRHSGRPLRFYPDSRLALALVFFAALSRALGALLWPSLLTIYLLPTLALLTAFTLYGLRYRHIFAHSEPH